MAGKALGPCPLKHTAVEAETLGILPKVLEVEVLSRETTDLAVAGKVAKRPTKNYTEWQIDSISKQVTIASQDS